MATTSQVRFRIRYTGKDLRRWNIKKKESRFFFALLFPANVSPLLLAGPIPPELGKLTALTKPNCGTTSYLVSHESGA